MAIPLFSGAVRALAAGTLCLSLGLAPALAHMAPPLAAPRAHAAIGPGHFAPFAFRGFHRFGAERFGFDRFGVNVLFDRFGFDRFGVNRFGFDRFGVNRFGFHRFGRNAGVWNWNQLGLGGWGYWDGPVSAPAAPSAPIIVGGGGPPVAINVYPGAVAGPGDAVGGCVIHQLQYDRAGNYVGERQIPNC